MTVENLEERIQKLESAVQEVQEQLARQPFRKEARLAVVCRYLCGLAGL